MAGEIAAVGTLIPPHDLKIKLPMVGWECHAEWRALLLHLSASHSSLFFNSHITWKHLFFSNSRALKVSRKAEILSPLGALYYNTGRYEEALQVYREAASLQPSNKETRLALVSMGWAWPSQGHLWSLLPTLVWSEAQSLVLSPCQPSSDHLSHSICFLLISCQPQNMCLSHYLSWLCLALPSFLEVPPLNTNSCLNGA